MFFEVVVLLPLGEGGPKGRMRACTPKVCARPPSPGASPAKTRTGHGLFERRNMLRRISVIVAPLMAWLVIAAPHVMFAQAPQSAATFNKDVLPILQKNCQNCHRPGQIAPMSLLTYKDARPWARAIKNAVVTRTMPPWFADPNYGHFSNERRLNPSEIDTIAKWADAGALEGDAKDAPRAIEWPEGGWQ